MRNKKGAGTIIAWVLLLGFSIGLATTVFLWTTRQTEEMTETSIRFVEGGMQCESVMINVATVDDLLDDKQCHQTCECATTDCCLKISNTRYLNVEKVILRGLDEDPPSSAECDEGSELKVKEFINCKESVGWSGKIEVLPIVKVKDEPVGCKNKAITVNC